MIEVSNNAIDIILTAELYHTLGADRLAQAEVNKLKLKDGRNNEFLKKLLKGLKTFYDLENEKFRIKNIEPKKTSPNDKNIDKRLYIYKGTLRRINQSELSLINSYLLYDYNGKSEINPESNRAYDFEKKVDSAENFIIYICYREIKKSIKYIASAASKAYDSEKFKENLVDRGILREFDRFFGKKVLEESSFPEIKRAIDAKLERFKGNSRFAYWHRIYKLTKEKQPEIYDILNGAIVPCFVGDAWRSDFIGNFIFLLLLKYHVLSHKISEGKQYSLFHMSDDVENGQFSLLSSYVSYKNDLVRCQKIFTFVRFIAKYYSIFFSSVGGPYVPHLFQALAYLRRGNTFFLQENYKKAFNDYNYGQNYLKNKNQSEGKEFDKLVEAYTVVLEAVCAGAKGECYRQDYDYDNAYYYFCQSVMMFELISKRPEEKSWMPKKENWDSLISYGLTYNVYIINKAKLFVVKGDLRRAIKWYCICLRNFFKLYKHIMILENGEPVGIIGHSNLIAAFDETIKYLENTKNNANIQKASLKDYLSDLTGQLDFFLTHNTESMKGRCRLTGLMADIFNRISMILYLIALPGKRHSERHKLSREWHQFAMNFNRFNGLARYNHLICHILEDGKGFFALKQEEIADENFLSLKHDGSLFDRFNRHFATWLLLSIVKGKERNGVDGSDSDSKKHKEIAAKLISRMFQYTDNFSLKNKEIFRYLTRERTIKGDIEEDVSTLYVLRRWSSFTPSIPRPQAFYNRGGGFFIEHKGKGIAIDPGFNFVVNLYQEGFSVNDIDAVLITHDHIDHHADFETLLTHWHLNQEMGTQSDVKEIFLNIGLVARYNFLLNQNKEYNVHSLGEGSIVIPKNPEHAYEVHVKKAVHKDLSTDDYSVGLILNLTMDNNKNCQIAFTGDTKFEKNILENYLNCDVILFNISSLPLSEMRNYLSLSNTDEVDHYKEKLKNVLAKFKEDEESDMSLIAKQLLYAYWYFDESPEAIKDLFSNRESVADHVQLNLGSHLYLRGILELNDMLTGAQPKRGDKPQLVIVTELKEEIGSFRNKIADELNKYNNYTDKLKYLTGDIGLTVRLRPKNLEEEPLQFIQVACSRCKLNNDYLYDDIFHPTNQIGDFCIKGEDEGIFYLCKRHDIPKPSEAEYANDSYARDEIFYQKIERYNVYGSGRA